MDYYIVTGASRGIGEAIVRSLIKPGNIIFAVSRNLNEDIIELASSLNIPLYYDEVDLSNPSEAEKFIRGVFRKMQPVSGERISLINNAGMLNPVGQVADLNFADVDTHLKLNFLAPFILSSVFISETDKFDSQKVILNISSGASTIPFRSWSVYCASKAALDMLTKVMGAEQRVTTSPVKTFALAPGIIETDMQQQIRNLQDSVFPDKQTFIDLFETGKLLKPEEVAKIITSTIFHPYIENGSVITLEQLKELSTYTD